MRVLAALLGYAVATAADASFEPCGEWVLVRPPKDAEQYVEYRMGMVGGEGAIEVQLTEMAAPSPDVFWMGVGFADPDVAKQMAGMTAIVMDNGELEKATDCQKAEANGPPSKAAEQNQTTTTVSSVTTVSGTTQARFYRKLVTDALVIPVGAPVRISFAAGAKAAFKTWQRHTQVWSAVITLPACDASTPSPPAPPASPAITDPCMPSPEIDLGTLGTLNYTVGLDESGEVAANIKVKLDGIFPEQPWVGVGFAAPDNMKMGGMAAFLVQGSQTHRGTGVNEAAPVKAEGALGTVVSSKQEGDTYEVEFVAPVKGLIPRGEFRLKFAIGAGTVFGTWQKHFYKYQSSDPMTLISCHNETITPTPTTPAGNGSDHGAHAARTVAIVLAVVAVLALGGSTLFIRQQRKRSLAYGDLPNQLNE